MHTTKAGIDKKLETVLRYCVGVRRYFLLKGLSQGESSDLALEVIFRAHREWDNLLLAEKSDSNLLMLYRISRNVLIEEKGGEGGATFVRGQVNSSAGAEREVSKYERLREQLLLFAARDAGSPQIRSDLLIVDDLLIKHLGRHPERMRELQPRKFEELVASLLEDMGYSVELTSRGADGGVDIIATQKSSVGPVLLIVDCKRYSPSRHVGVGIVRSLYGVSEQLRATQALLATTSFFSRPAREFEAQVPHRLSLRDYNDLVQWLQMSSTGSSGGYGCLTQGLKRTPDGTA